ncbi:MAG TPA: hypothetical protein PLU39_09905 [Armatimonadota bacterium]|mgnify:CR=1 FL=1|jgi:hypothetical protein|nr:hypothetical protein [Armatimonadota bacterium]HOM81531.1 hypothetical protein [Armatimonadota bacterium]HPO71973.1 hypothetical protein [Armatimonadota bacterium]HPT98172.1 hypothetical protein [Armatimonadota bacterium]
MVILAIMPLVLLTIAILGLTGIIQVEFMRDWSRDMRRALLAGTIAVGSVLYLYHGSYCEVVSPDGHYRASIRYNGLLLRAGMEDPEVVIEGAGRDGLYVVARQKLDATNGWPQRLVWHPDGRRVACVQQQQGMPPYCRVVRISPHVAVSWYQRVESLERP